MKKLFLITAAIALLLSCEKEVSPEVGKEAGMPVVNGVTQPPISVSDVAGMLGVNSGDVGYLCSNQHGKINKWAKYKPVIFQAFDNSNANWWKGTNLNAGISIPQGYGAYTVLADAIRNLTLQDWTYEPPVGGVQSPYRLTDFNGYDHNAVQPIRSGNGNSTIYIEEGYTTFSLGYFINEGGEGSLKLTDLKLTGDDYFNDLYFGVFMFNNQRSFCSTNNVTLGEMSLSDAAVVSVAGMQENWTGVYTVMPVFSTRPLTVSDSSTPGTIYPVPFVKETVNIELRVSNVTISGGAFWNVNDLRQLYYGFRIFNNRDFVLETGTIYIRLLDANKSVLWTKTLPSQTIGERGMYMYPSENEMAVESNMSDAIATNAKYIQYSILPLGGIVGESEVGISDPNNN